MAELLALPAVSIDDAHIFGDVQRFDHRHADQPRGRVMTVDEAAAELGISVDDVIAGRHPRLPSPAATFDELAARGVYPGAAVHEQPRTEAEPQRWAVDEDRAELDERIQTYAADHNVSYADAFAAIADEDRF